MSDIKLICQVYLHWDESKWQAELDRYRSIMQKHYSLPES